MVHAFGYVTVNVAIAASADFLDLDDGWPALRFALLAAGLQPRVAVWDDPSVDWSHFDLVAAMYTWGYVTRRAAFLAWAERVEAVTRLVNSASHLGWSSDKTYLPDLAAIGVPVVPTAWVRLDEPWCPPAEDYVIKPTVASGGLGAARYRTSGREVADRHVRRLNLAGVHGEDPALPTLHRHCWRDRAGLPRRPLQSGCQQVRPPGSRRRRGRAAVGARGHHHHRTIPRLPAASGNRDGCGGDEARADGVRPGRSLAEDDDGRPQVLEVELVEPSLFLETDDGSGQRLAASLQPLAERSV